MSHTSCFGLNILKHGNARIHGYLSRSGNSQVICTPEDGVFSSKHVVWETLILQQQDLEIYDDVFTILLQQQFHHEFLLELDDTYGKILTRDCKTSPDPSPQNTFPFSIPCPTVFKTRSQIFRNCESDVSLRKVHLSVEVSRLIRSLGLTTVFIY